MRPGNALRRCHRSSPNWLACQPAGLQRQSTSAKCRRSAVKLLIFVTCGAVGFILRWRQSDARVSSCEDDHLRGPCLQYSWHWTPNGYLALMLEGIAALLATVAVSLLACFARARAGWRYRQPPKRIGDSRAESGRAYPAPPAVWSELSPATSRADHGAYLGCVEIRYHLS
jgi:hypothetical protein